MDSRVTLKTNESFLDLVFGFYQEGQKVDLLIDEFGMQRESGLILDMINSDSVTYVVLENGAKIDLNKIIAVNGVFRPEYGEC